jgi:hypothetical protein
MSTDHRDEPCEWELDATKQKKGRGMWVKRDGRRGYAKFDCLEKELVGAELAALVGAPVPSVELGIIRGNRAAVSHVQSSDTSALSCCSKPDQEILAALNKASGLIPFLAWIASGDHGKLENFVITPNTHGDLEVQAIDFDNCFEWSVGFDYVPMIQELTRYPDLTGVETVLSAIENLSCPSVVEACGRAGIPSAQAFAERLNSRKEGLRAWLMQKGFLGPS